MAQLWGGRFTKETDQLVYHFNASISFDRKLFEEDIEGSIAHAVMLDIVRRRKECHCKRTCGYPGGCEKRQA